MEMQRSYHLNNDEQTEVEKENVAQAYRYGKTLVPLTADDKKTLKLDAVKCCSVLGFTSKKNISIDLHSRDGCYIFTPQPGDEHAAVAFSAFCHALEVKEMVAIVRFVFRANADPKLGFLTPHIKSSYESLIFVTLPFREDIRQYYFPPLPPPSSATAEQKAAVNGLIDNMMLVTQDEGEEGEEEEKKEKELLKSTSMMNPVTQRQCQCVQDRALNPEQLSIADVEAYIVNALQPLPQMVNQCKRSFDEIAEHFPMREVENKAKKSKDNMFNKPSADNVKQDDNNADNDADNNDAFTLHGLSKTSVTEVGTVDPVADYLALLDGCTTGGEAFMEVSRQMSKCAVRLVEDSFMRQYYDKALRCVTTLREQSEKHRVATVFNTLLNDMKEQMCGKRRDDFWQELVSAKILPLGKDVAEDSSFTNEEAETFYSSSGEVKPVDDDPEDLMGDDDDLLDML